MKTRLAWKILFKPKRYSLAKVAKAFHRIETVILRMSRRGL